jgi:hypothetical protein
MNDFVAKPVRKRLLVEKLVAVAVAVHENSVPGIESPALVPAAPTAAGVDDMVLIDWPVLAELAGEIGEDGAGEILGVFRRETAERIELMAGCSQSDRATIEVEAHTLKGAAGAVGFARVSTLAHSLEREAKVIAPADCTVLMASISDAFARSCREIEEHPLASARMESAGDPR